MATLLLPPGPPREEPTRTGEATFVLALSPIPGPDGRLHTARTPLPAGQTVAAALAGRQTYQRVVWNGAVLEPERYAEVLLHDGDELWAFPAWGVDPFSAAFLIPFAVGLAISIATTALTYVLFPPAKPHIQAAPDEHTFSFSGIQTAIGPGNMVPVIYGRHRVGGQLLSASVDQFLTVLDNGAAVIQMTASALPPTMTLLIGLGEGPIDAVLTDTIELNGQPISNFPGVQIYTRLGTGDQTPIVEFNETRNTFADGRNLPDNSSNTGQQIVYTTTAAVTAFVLNIVWNQGLFHMTSKGDKEDEMVNVAYQIKLHGAPAFGAYSVFQVSAARTAPVRFGIRKENLPLGVYDIAVNFGGIRHGDELHGQFQPTLESVTEIQGGAQAYPYTALLGIRSVAMDALQGSLPNVTVEVRGRTVRVGTFTQVETWSDNPAWCIMDALTHRRYGDGILDSEIDLGAFAIWAAYNDEIRDGERRHTFNYVLEREGRVQALLLEMMGGSRTLMLKSEGLWTPRPTRNDAPVQLLSWATCANLKVTYTRDPDRVNVMEARFANEEDGFQQDVLTWPSIDNWPAEVHKASLETRGVTKPSRVTRALQFELNRRQYENVVIEFDNALDAVTLQVHDLFRFAHPLPGWGASGRVMEGSTASRVILDAPVTMQAGVTYQLYLKFVDDYTEARIVFNPGDTTTTILQFGVPFTGDPPPRMTLWAFGTADPDGAVKIFRAVKVERNSDTSVRIQAVVHNPSIYDEAIASPLPGTPGLFNPLGPPPPLTFLVATELTRIQANGTSLRVANLSWDVGPLAAGFAPYAGAKIFRRFIFVSSSGGVTDLGTVDLGALQGAGESNINFVLLSQVRGHVLEFDDYTVIQGGTYLYRVIPVSQRDIPNEGGALEAVLHISGATTPDFFPGTPQRLRLRGQSVGVLTWEGKDVHLEWDPPPDVGGLFSSTFFVNDYRVEVWAPGQEYLLRSTTTGGVLSFAYTLDMNTSDSVSAGHPGARRDLMFRVWAITNTGRISLDPAVITVTNPPPDMSNILPDCVALFQVAIINWDQFAEPLDFDHYEVHLDIVDPPVAIYQDIAIAFHGYGASMRKVFPQGLGVGVKYYTFILPYDTFGPGIRSQTATFTPVALDADSLDTEPPAIPTGLTLTTGSDVGPDGTIGAWVEASWNIAPENDVAGYEVDVFVGDSVAPTIFSPTRGQHVIRFPVPGNIPIRVKLLTFDKFHNMSDFGSEATITTARDTIGPAADRNLLAIGSIRSVQLLWTPPPDADYDYSEVWVSSTNNRALGGAIGFGKHSWTHDAMTANDTRYYWVRSVDTSGNVGPFFPLSATAGVQGTAGLLNTTFISDLACDKLTSGIIQAQMNLGVGQRIFLDGVGEQILIVDDQAPPRGRVQLGRLGAGGVGANSPWGIRIFNGLGQMQWNLTDGATEPGITNAAVTATKISAATIAATHLRTDTAVVTIAAQIANAIIGDQHINNLSANKITTGTLNAAYSIGVGLFPEQFVLDGNNRNMRVYDENGRLRVAIGRLTTENIGYGVWIFDPYGNLMWDLEGASTLGIHDLAVTNAKIANAAITNAKIDDAAITNAKIGNLEVDYAKIANLTVGTAKIAYNAVTESVLFAGSGGGIVNNAYTEYARITWPFLAAGDQVVLWGTCNSHGAGAGSLATFLTLREDDVNGTVHHSAIAMGTDASSSAAWIPMAVQGVYTAPTDLVNKAFVLGSLGINTIQDVRFTGIRRQR